MTAHGDKIDLAAIGLKPGGGWREDIVVGHRAFVFGEQRYEPVPPAGPVRVQVSRTTTGFVLRVRFEAAVRGPCMRCFDDQDFVVAVDQTEVHEPQLELASEYVDGSDFDLVQFVHGAIGLALGQTMSGELDATGRCLLCDRSREQLAQLGIGDAKDDDEHDPRWAKLRELEL